MNGAELLIKTAVNAGIEVCFTNPGTTELPLVEAFDGIAGIRPVLGLFEGCCSGAADGYARMTGKPAMTLFHLGPGLGNAVANLHNARRARSPVLNIVGDHAGWHRDADAPLTMDIEMLSRTVSGWTRSAASVETISDLTVQAVAAARCGCVATLIVPQDVQWSELRHASLCSVEQGASPVDEETLTAAARFLRQNEPVVMVLGGGALREKGLKAAARIQSISHCGLLAETFPAHMARGAGLPAIERIPYAPEAAQSLLSSYRGILLAGAREPVAFFGYRNGLSRLVSREQRTLHLSADETHLRPSLEALADLLDAPSYEEIRTGEAGKVVRPPLPEGALRPKKIGAVIAALQPENAVVVDESITSGVGYFSMTATVPPFSLLTLTGGAIGQGMPCAAGAAIACPERPVINFQADGSAMYTVQSLWMQARESLNVTTLICANQRYKILERELARSGNMSPGTNTEAMFHIGDPVIDWVRLGKSMGIPAVSVTTAPELAHALGGALGTPGPFLIEMALA